MIENVKAHGIGEILARVEGCGASVVTLNAREKVNTAAT